MKDTINSMSFIYEMTKDRYGFSNEGASALFDYLTQLEEDTGSEFEFDPVAFSCEWAEYESLEQLNKYYPEYNYIQHSPNVANTLKDYEDRTQVIKVFNFNGSETQRLLIHEF